MTVAGSCGVTFERWVTELDAARDLLRPELPEERAKSPKLQHVEPVRIAGAGPVRMPPSELRAESQIESNACAFLRVTDDPLIPGLEGTTEDVGLEDRSFSIQSHLIVAMGIACANSWTICWRAAS